MPLHSGTSITKNPSVDAHPTAGWQGGSLHPPPAAVPAVGGAL